MDPILEPGMYRRAPKAIERFFPKNRVLSRAGVHADGSCFFHSLSAALNLDRTTDTRMNPAEKSDTTSGVGWRKSWFMTARNRGGHFGDPTVWLESCPTSET